MLNINKGYILSGAVAIGTIMASIPTSAQEITLKFANWLPSVHHWTKTARAFADSIEQASGGKINVSIDKGPLAKPPGQFDLAVNGVRDMIMHVAAYTPGRFVFYRMAEVPFATKKSETGSVGFAKWYAKHGFEKEEFKGAKLMAAFVHGPGLLHSKKEIKTLEDLKGVKIRVGGGGVLIAKSLGAVPVAMSATKAHESLQRGTTDAAFFPYEAVHGFKLSKLVKFHLRHKRIATLTTVKPPARFGEAFLKGNRISKFEEKSQLTSNWINGGFFVFNYKIFSFISGDQIMLEREPFTKLTKFKQLMAYKHHGFWQCMDTMRDKNILKKAVIKSCKIKSQIVSKDEKEKNLRMILNFGHTFAHGFEAAKNFSKKINHGEAVLLGMMLANQLAYNKKILSLKDLMLIKKHYIGLNLPIKISKFFKRKEINKIIHFMKRDKKNFSGKINLILLKKIGNTIKPNSFNISSSELKKFLIKQYI